MLLQKTEDAIGFDALYSQTLSDFREIRQTD